MNFQRRKQIIFQKLEENGEVEIKELAAELDTSEITIRRDLKQFSDDGLLYRTHGGAMKINLIELPHQFANKTAINAKAKDNICRRAASEIVDGDIVFLDCGSTVFRLCQFIKNKKIKVITNSIPVIIELQNSLVSLNIIGGEFDSERQAVHGNIASEHISKYRTGKAFLGVDGVSEKGLFSHSEKEASITMAMSEASAYTYLLFDKTKFGKESYLQFAPVELADAIITDCESGKMKSIKKKGIRIMHV